MLIRFLIVFVSLHTMAIAQIEIPYCKHGHQLPKKGNPILLLKGLNDNKRSDTTDILSYSVYLDFSEAPTQNISGNCEIRFTPKMNGIDYINLDLLQMSVDSITDITGQLSFNYNDTLLHINLRNALISSDTSEITVFYKGQPQQDPSGFGGFYFDGAYAYNLGVAFEADPHNYGRVWHPCVDNFAERATYKFTVLTNLGKKSYCNGELTSEQNLGDTTIRVWELDDPIPTYLASVATGNLVHARMDHVSALTGNNIPVWLISESNDTSSFKNAFQNLDEAIDIFEAGYGEHVWNKVGFVAVPFSSGAMEHPTNISYPQAVIGSGTTYEGLMAHEFAHHWWGDLITCATENEMWINEGLATYSEHLFTDKLYGNNAYIDEVRANHKDVLLNAHRNDEGHYPLANVPHQFTYGDHSYLKGADVMHTLRGQLGDSLFFKGLKSVIANNQFQSVSSEEFRDEITSSTGQDVTDFFEGWILNAGFPQFSIDSFDVLPNGLDYDVTVHSAQRLMAAPNYYQNVKLQITFMDDSWERYDTVVTLSGFQDQKTFSVPFHPTLVFLNSDNLVNMAATADEVKFKIATNINLNQSEIRPYVTSISDSAFLRFEHNWVPADDFKFSNTLNNQFTLSDDRYWTIKGILPSDFDGHIRFTLKGHLENFLDYNLFNGPSNFAFVEDSVKLFYRSNAAGEWSIMPNTNIISAGSSTDGFAYLDTDTLMLGEYCFGWRTSPVSVQEKEKNNIKIYPNPASEEVWIDLSEYGSQDNEVSIYDLSGKLVQRKSARSSFILINLQNESPGTYLVSVLSNGKFIHSQKILIQ